MSGLKEILDGGGIVFFGGAGVSTESGIPDFRSANGIFVRGRTMPYRPEDIVSHAFLQHHPDIFYDFYKKHMLYPDAKPNGAHLALAKLEKQGKLDAVITQNIDGLHQAAGSKTCLELHGSVHRNYCVKCGKKYGLDHILASEGIPRCECGGLIRPDVVLYGEQLDENVLSGSIEYISRARVLVVGGTSLGVYPAAGLLNYFRGEKIVLINKTPTPWDSAAALVLRGNIGEVLDAAVD